MILSILIATMTSRRDKFSLLMGHLQKQKTQGVEIIANCDDGQLSIGTKRQILLSQAQGKYVCFIDDDDWVPENYIANILSAVETNPDCVGFLVALDGYEKDRII